MSGAPLIELTFYHVGLEAVAKGVYTGVRQEIQGVSYLEILWYHDRERRTYKHMTRETNILGAEKIE